MYVQASEKTQLQRETIRKNREKNRSIENYYFFKLISFRIIICFLILALCHPLRRSQKQCFLHFRKQLSVLLIFSFTIFTNFYLIGSFLNSRNRLIEPRVGSKNYIGKPVQISSLLQLEIKLILEIKGWLNMT